MVRGEQINLMKKKIALFGAGGHAVSCIDVIETEKKYKIDCILDKYSNKKYLGKYKVIKENDINIERLKKRKIFNIVICIGQIKTSKVRKELFNKLKKKGFNFPVIKSPRSIVSKKSLIEEGSVIFHNTTINAGAHIGKNCIINSSSLIEHGVKIGNNSHVATGVIINGDCNIGRDTFIGSGSILKHGLKLKAKSFVKMGSLVKK